MLSVKSSLQILYHVWNAYNELSYEAGDTRHYHISRSQSQQDIAALRLVNRAFCRSASPWLFRHIKARSRSYPKIPPLERLMKLSTSPYAVHVCEIEFGFGQNESRSTNALYIEHLVGILALCLDRVSNLKALKFLEPPSSLSQDKSRSIWTRLLRRYVTCRFQT